LRGTLRIAAPFLSHRPRDARYLDEIVEKLKRKVGDLPRALPEWGLCHGDLHKTNVMVDKHGQVAIIDWDCAGYGWRAYDLAVLRWSIGPAVGRDGIGAPRLSQVWEAYLHHYQAIRPLSAAEIEAIPYFVAIRHIRVLGWEINNATSGPWGMNLLSERFFDEYIGTLKGWEADELA
jgi:Ser/Thr protein kinase RdoA (MazF antagonist)